MTEAVIHIDWFSISGLDSAARARLLQLDGLPVSEQQRISKLRKESDRLLSVGGIYLLQRTGFDLKRFTRTAYNQPVDREGAFFFNISHAGDLVVLAWSKHLTMGIDVEHMLPVKVSDYFLVMTPEEQATTITSADFYRLWTEKEAVIKALGHGFQQDVREIQRIGNTAILNGQVWHLYPVHLQDNYCTTLATEARQCQISVRQIATNELFTSKQAIN